MGLKSRIDATMEKIRLAKFIQVIPAVQLSNQQRKQYEDVITIGDIVRTFVPGSADGLYRYPASRPLRGSLGNSSIYRHKSGAI